MPSTAPDPADKARSTAGGCPVASRQAPLSGGINPEIPGPDPMPILGWRGNVLRYFRDALGYMKGLRERYGDVACLVRGGNDPLIFHGASPRAATLFGFGAQCNREILSQSNDFESDVVKTPGKCPWLGDNMVATNRQERARQRRTIMPALTAEHLRAYYPDFVSLTEAMLARWRPGLRVNLSDEIENLTAAIASKTFYGQVRHDHPQALAAIARKVAHALFSPAARIPIDFPGTPYRRFLDLTARAEETILSEISRRRAAGNDGDDILSMMLRAIAEGNVELSHDHLVGNAFTLFLAGHDVPANALGWVLFLLAQHPAVMADLLDELESRLGGGPPAYEEVFKLPVLDRVVKESMRVLSPAIIMWRRPMHAVGLGGFEIPAGSEVLVSPYLTHTDPQIYDAPLAFRPGRWETMKPSPFEFLPFSYGARKCLGAAFAEIQIRVVLSLVVQRFRLELIPGTRVDPQVTMTMKPKGGLPVVLREQDRQFDRSPADVRGKIREMVDLR